MSHIARRTQGAVIYCEHVRPSSGGSDPSWPVRSKVPSSSTRPQGPSCTLSPGHTLPDCLCLGQQSPWLGPPPQSLSLWPSAARESVSGAPAALSLPRHPAVASHTAACCRIVRRRQRQCHCHRRAQRAPTLPLTFTLSPSTAPPSPGALAVDCSGTRPRSESKPCRKPPQPPPTPPISPG